MELLPHHSLRIPLQFITKPFFNPHESSHEQIAGAKYVKYILPVDPTVTDTA